MSNCPNCQQAVGPGDNVCENCEALLAMIAPSQAQFVMASPAPLPSTPGSLALCPTCQTPTKPGDDICENCGMVLTATAINVTHTTAPKATSTSTPVTGPSPSILTECPRCHARRKPGRKFCNSCGLRYDTLPPVSGIPKLPTQSGRSLKVGELLSNKYKILREIGEGGMGAVFLAEDQLLKRQVIIKALVNEDDPDLITQSIKEREFLATIKHANIVSIYDFIANGQQGYIVMEYVHGKTLDQIMMDQGKPFEVMDAIKYILEMLPAFTYLARLGLVYCDFKPQNMMLEVLKDGTKIVKLIDLGTVIQYEPHPDSVYGTHGFYAPEAVKTPSPETDLYSICRTLAYLTTEMDLASPVFGMPSIESYKAFRDHPAFYRLLVRGTHTNARRRFHSAEQLGDQLTGVLRQIEGGQPGQPIVSRLFISGMLTTTGKLGLRGEAELDETDPALDLLRAGDRALRNANYASAIGFYHQATRQNRKSVDAHLRLAEVFIEQSEFNKARQEIENARTTGPNNWKVTWYTARLSEATGSLRDAADHYHDLVEELPGELPPQQALARVYAHMEQYPHALDLYRRVLKADPDNTEAILGAADALLKQHNWQEAIQLLQAVNEATARYIEAQLLLCDIYLNNTTSLTAQDLSQAVQAIQALAGKTEDPRYYLARGDIYRLLWQLARQRKLSSGISIPTLQAVTPNHLGRVAEESYIHYLRNVPHGSGREAVVRKKLEVAPWRLF